MVATKVTLNPQSLKRFLSETSPIFLCFSGIVSELTYYFNIESNEIIVPVEDDWYAYAFDELLKDLIAVWQDLKWPGPYVVTWNAVATAPTLGFRHSLPDSANMVPWNSQSSRLPCLPGGGTLLRQPFGFETLSFCSKLCGWRSSARSGQVSRRCFGSFRSFGLHYACQEHSETMEGIPMSKLQQNNKPHSSFFFSHFLTTSNQVFPSSVYPSFFCDGCNQLSQRQGSDGKQLCFNHSSAVVAFLRDPLRPF